MKLLPPAALAAAIGLTQAARPADSAPLVQPPPKADKAGKSGLMPSEKAKPLIAEYVKDSLHGKQVKVDKISGMLPLS
jgi:hypothetical protein